MFEYQWFVFLFTLTSGTEQGRWGEVGGLFWGRGSQGFQRKGMGGWTVEK